jgi:hypothetical protein
LVEKEKLVQITESAIDNLIMAFKATPYFFYTESDLHCYLYGEILNKLPLEDWECKTKDGKSSILLHKEYPTKERYSAKALKKKFQKVHVVTLICQFGTLSRQKKDCFE